MIRIEIKNETPEGKGIVIMQQMTGIIDRLYDASPTLFEMALLHSQYTKDHT